MSDDLWGKMVMADSMERWFITEPRIGGTSYVEEVVQKQATRIEELEAKLTIYEAALKHIAQHDTQMRAIKALSDAKGDDDD